MTDLHDLLDRATDRIEAPLLAAPALVAARRRRTRVRGAAVSVAVAGAVAAAILVPQRTTDVAPSPAPAPTPTPAPSYEPPALDAVTDGMVRDALDVEADYPDDERLPLPESLAPSGNDVGLTGPAVAVVQTVDGKVSALSPDGTWRSPANMPDGRLFPESLASDGGALALRSESAMEVYSLFAGRAFSYDVAPVATTGLWANDSVGLFYDVPGRGGETREHEGARSIDSVAFPKGEGLGDITMDPRGNTLFEFVDDDLVVWSDFQDVGIRRDARQLGDLHRPVAQDGKVAVIRSGLAGNDPAAADGVVVIGADLSPVALLPVVGVDVGEVVIHDFVDVDTLLIEVGDRLVTWNHRTGELLDVATLPTGAAASFAYWNLQGY